MTTDEHATGTIVEGHAGAQAVAALRAAGAEAMFTLNGGHIWPLYEAARDQGLPVIDLRHEASVTFAAEAAAKLTRRPGVAALTAGPGITNGVSAITSASFNGSPLVVLGGRAPHDRWGSGSLQEFDPVPMVTSISKQAITVVEPDRAGMIVSELIDTALAPHRGPVFADFPLDRFGPTAGPVPAPSTDRGRGADPDPAVIAEFGAALRDAERPALIVGSDAYHADAGAALAAVAAHFDLPVLANGLGRGLLPADDERAFMRVRGVVKRRADLVVVIGTPLDFRLGFGTFGDARVIHVVDHDSQRAEHVDATTIAADIAVTLADLAAQPGANHRDWLSELGDIERAAVAAESGELNAGGDVIKPSRVYGELRKRLARDAVVVCDGGDFISYAGKYVEVFEPGCWLDTGPFGCLGNGLGYTVGARATRPDSQVVTLLGDGAAGFSLMDVDSLVRHDMAAVMIVGNNGLWGLEKHPMQAIYGWDVACDLQPDLRYDDIVTTLGGAGETVTKPDDVGPALDRAFASGVPYLVNVMTDPADVYPRSSNLA